MKTNPAILPSATSATSLPTAPAAAPGGQPGSGRPSQLTARMIDALCSVIRRTGVSDSAAAARMCVHPSTLSRWKRDSSDLVILLRTAREDFRDAHFAIIEAAANAGHASSWRASAWILERVFPEDYAPNAKQRALFQERFEAICAGEGEGGAVELPDSDRVEPLQNVKNSLPVSASPAPSRVAAAAPAPEPELTLDLTPAHGRDFDVRLPGKPLQNVKNSPLSAPFCPPVVTPHGS